MQAREIKFDAIYQPTGEHFTPYNIDFTNMIVTGNFDGEINAWCHFSLDGQYGDVILRQYTGITDRNGNDIYEGDILKNYYQAGIHFDPEDYIIQTVKRRKFGWGPFVDVVGGTRHGYAGELYEFEVIGNLYENKELIESE